MARRARQAFRRALPFFGAAAFAYAAYPYVTLYRLSYAIRHGDSSVLETLVDWDEVREGIKEDVCDTLAEEPAASDSAAAKPAQEDDATLPAFGSGFVRGIASHVIDANVTPRAIMTAVKADSSIPKAAHPAHGQPEIEWAFFDSPTTFSVLLRPSKHASPIRIQMELRDREWKITRAWLPRELLIRANERT